MSSILLSRLLSTNEQIAQINDMQWQNRKLELSFESVIFEITLSFIEEVNGMRSTANQLRDYKHKYEIVSVEKLELENVLEVHRFDRENLQKDSSTTKEELETPKGQYFELEKSKENMEKLLDFLQKKFRSPLALCEKQLCEHFSFYYLLFWYTGFRDITCLTTKLEEVDNYTCEKIEDKERTKHCKIKNWRYEDEIYARYA